MLKTADIHKPEPAVPEEESATAQLLAKAGQSVLTLWYNKEKEESLMPKILVVDDDRAIAELVSDALEDEGAFYCPGA